MPLADLYHRLGQRSHYSVGSCASEAFLGLIEIAGKSPNPSQDLDLRQLEADPLAQRPRLRESKRGKRGNAHHILRFRRQMRQYFLERGTYRQRKYTMAGALQQLSQHGRSDLVGLIIRRQTENANSGRRRLGIARGKLLLLGRHPARPGSSRFRQTFVRPINGQLRNDFAYAEKQKRLARLIQPSFVAVLFGQGEGWNHDLVIKDLEGVSPQKIRRDGSSILLVQSEQSLVKLRFDGQGSFIAQQNMEKRHAWNIASQYDQTNRKGNRQNQPRPSPKRRPENCRYQQSERRYAGVCTVQPGFHEICRDQFQKQEHEDNQKRGAPAIEYRKRERKRQ